MSIFSRLLMVFKAKANSALDRVEDPRQMMDYAYEEQKQLLVKTKRGLVEVATSKALLQKQAEMLRGKVHKVEDQARRALGAGREDLARIALERKHTITAQIVEMDQQVTEVGEDERRLTETEQQLAMRIEEFKTRRDVVSARYTAAKAQVRINEAFTGVSGEFADLSMALGRAVEKTERMQARAGAIGSLIESGALALPGEGSDRVEQELAKVTVERAIDDDMAALKAELEEGDGPPALKSGN